MVPEDTFLCKLVTWNEIDYWTENVVKKITKAAFKPDTVIALIRGGLVPARLVCDHLALKNLFAVKVEHWGITAQPDMKAKLIQGVGVDLSGQKVLVVDDITDTGESMALSIEHLRSRNPKELKSASLLHISHSKFEPDFYDVFVPKEKWAWFIFPWNLHEDIRTLVLKTIETPKNSRDVADHLKTQFQIVFDHDKVEEALLRLKSCGQVFFRNGKWCKAR